MNLDAILEGSIAIILYLQDMGNSFIGIMKLFTFLGNEEFYLLLFPVLFWCIDNNLGFRAGLILLLSTTINSYFKWMFRLPRPYWINDEVVAHTSETSFGAPSGHSQNAVVMWGLIASSIQKPWSWRTAIFIIIMIGLSRMVLGVHFLLDVITGWAIGAFLLWIFLRFEPTIQNWLREKSHWIRMLISFLVSIGLIAVAVLILRALSYWEVPNLWVQKAQLVASDSEPINPLTLSDVVSNAGILFGVSAGYIILNQLGGFNARAKLFQQVLKYTVGISGVLAIWLGLDFIFPDGETLVAFTFRYIRYGLTGVWISLGAPWIFIRTGLAKSA